MVMQYDLVRSGTTIRQLRIQNGYTQENLAKMLNIDRSFFSYIESGKRGCSVDLLLGSTQDCVLRRAEFNRLKADMENLIIHLEMFKSSLEEM